MVPIHDGVWRWALCLPDTVGGRYTIQVADFQVLTELSMGQFSSGNPSMAMRTDRE